MDTSSNDYYVRVYLREDTSGNGNKIDLRFYPNQALLLQYYGSWTQLDSNGGATTTQGTWYEVVAKIEGSNVWVWRGVPGGSMDLVLDTENATVMATDTLMFYVPAGAQVRVDDVGVEDASHTTTSTLGYNAGNELTSMTDGSATINFTYDPWGRMVSKYQGQTYSAAYAYRYGDKLYSVTSSFPNEGAVTYQYSADGKRRSRTAGSSQAWYNWDPGWNLVSEEDSAAGTGDLTMTYVLDDLYAEVVRVLADVAGSSPATGSYRYYFLDQIRSTRRLHAQDKSTLGTFQFDPYGTVYSHTGAPSTPFFTGKPWDSTSQLYYFPYRYYSPTPARWLTRDPLGIIDGPNVYGYALQNPAMYDDPLGGWVYACTRTALGPARHAYFQLDPNYGASSFYGAYFKLGGKRCGMNSSSGSGSGYDHDQESEEPGRNVKCKAIPNSKGHEMALMHCCDRIANRGVWIPGIHDCHNVLKRCIRLVNRRRHLDPPMTWPPEVGGRL
jgi:RHS repeat-associated protein